ncbi:MAG: LysR family transcriptional regulator [Oscillospiraceae bacterium]|nr:LysR family transcriptional regulator [Oscillospiraceae bacterium]
MTIRHLRIFVSVCRHESITLAANELYMSQPAVSLAIKELEENYGIKLFDRLMRKIKITEDGKRMLEYATHIIALFDEMERAVTNPDAAGELRIGSSLTIGACLIPGYIGQLAEKAPAITPRIVIDNSDNIVNGVLSGQLDIGLIEGTVDDPSLVVKNFMDDRIVAICGSTHPFAERTAVSLDEFLSQPLFLREHGSGTREIFQSAVTLLGKTLVPTCESISTTAIIRAVEAGSGVSVLPERLVEGYVQAGTVKKLELSDISYSGEHPLSRSFHLIYHKNKYISPSLELFIATVQQ